MPETGSVIAGTIMQGTHLPLRTWFMAAHLVTTHSNGISASSCRVSSGSAHKTVWLLLHKLRRAMVDPYREPLGGVDEVVQVDERVMRYRRKADIIERLKGEPDADKMDTSGNWTI